MDQEKRGGRLRLMGQTTFKRKTVNLTVGEENDCEKQKTGKLKLGMLSGYRLMNWYDREDKTCDWQYGYGSSGTYWWS